MNGEPAYILLMFYKHWPCAPDTGRTVSCLGLRIFCRCFNRLMLIGQWAWDHIPCCCTSAATNLCSFILVVKLASGLMVVCKRTDFSSSTWTCPHMVLGGYRWFGDKQLQNAYCCMLPHFWPLLTLFFTRYLNYRIVPLGVETIISYVKLHTVYARRHQ